jgi:20S proteasome subunit beta 3
LPQTLATDYKKVHKIHDQLFIGLAGLGTDAETLAQRFKFKHNLFKLREERDIKPSAFGQLVSATLYERRFGPYFCQPVIGALCCHCFVARCCCCCSVRLQGSLC